MHLDLTEHMKHMVDALSIATMVGTLAQALPAFAALFTIIWTGIRIYESNTVQKLLGRPLIKPSED